MRFTNYSDIKTHPTIIIQLTNKIRSHDVCKSSVIRTEDLPPGLLKPVPAEFTSADPKEEDKKRLLIALESAKGNHTMAAKLLDISRATFYRRLDELEINNKD